MFDLCSSLFGFYLINPIYVVLSTHCLPTVFYLFIPILCEKYNKESQNFVKNLKKKGEKSSTTEDKNVLHCCNKKKCFTARHLLSLSQYWPLGSYVVPYKYQNAMWQAICSSALLFWTSWINSEWVYLLYYDNPIFFLNQS